MNLNNRFHFGKIHFSCKFNSKFAPISFILFISSCCIWFLWKISSLTMIAIPDGSMINTLIHFSTLFLILFSTIFWVRKFNLIVLGLCLMLIGFLGWIFSGQSMILDSTVILFASTPWNKKLIISIILILISLFALIIIVMSQLGIIVDYTWPRSVNELRHGLGFLYCTYPAHLLFFMVVSFSFLRDGKLNIFEYLAIILVDIYLYVMTDARNACGLVILYLILLLIISHIKVSGFFDYKLIRYFTKSLFFIGLFVSILITILYNPANQAWNSLNDLVTGRFQQTHDSFYNYGCTLFGQEIELEGNGLTVTEDGVIHKESVSDDHNFIDNGYMSLLIHNGVIPTLLMVTLATSIILYATNTHNYVLILACIFMGLHALLDPQCFELPFNLLLLLSPSLLNDQSFVI